MGSAPMTPQKKIDLLRDAMRADDWAKALSIASRFPRLGKQDSAIRAGHEAMQRPDFQRQIGKDPCALIRSGIAALKERYGAE